MGFGNLATTVIMFIAVLLLATAVIATFKTQIDQSQSSMRAQADFLNNQIRTSISITSTNYTAGNLRVYVINDGKTIMPPERIDVYVDNEFIPRNETYRIIAIEPSTDLTNPGLWDPGEILRIDIDTTLDPGTHRVAIGTPYSVRDEELFSV
jgi:archaellum component FlaG (FlaF/FlaG flagellin family)